MVHNAYVFYFHYVLQAEDIIFGLKFIPSNLKASNRTKAGVGNKTSCSIDDRLKMIINLLMYNEYFKQLLKYYCLKVQHSLLLLTYSR